MDKKKLKVVHYLNQFFGQIGGEDRADEGFSIKEGGLGPGMALQKELGNTGQIAATVVCGDNYFAKEPEKAAVEGLKLIESYKPDIFFAGPAFAAGRYGLACGAICKAVEQNLGIPAITGMFIENPGVEIYRKFAYIVKTGNSARDMVHAIEKMVGLGLHLTINEKNKSLLLSECRPRTEEFDYFHRLIMRNEHIDKTAAERSVELLLLKIKGQPFKSEVAMPKFEKVSPPEPIEDLAKCELALVSDGGLVPKGNPDGLSSRGNQRWATYQIDKFFPESGDRVDYEIAHVGYYPVEVLANSNRLVPVDALRDAVKEKKLGKLHNSFFSTSGNSTVSRRCAEMGDEIGAELKKRGVNAAILTST